MKRARPHQNTHNEQAYRTSHFRYTSDQLPQVEEVSAKRAPHFSHRFVGFRLVKSDEEPSEEWQTTMGSLHELLPTGARRMEWDDENPGLKAENVSFRLALDSTQERT